MNISLGLLGNKIQYPETAEIWDGLTRAFDENSIKYTFLSETSDVNAIEEKSINLLFTINDQGIKEWIRLISTPVPFVIWGFDLPLNLYEVLQKLSVKQNLTFLSASAMDLSFIRYSLPSLNVIFLPNGIDKTFIPTSSTEKKYDISYAGSIIDIEKHEKHLKENMPPEAYRLIIEMVELVDRNPEASLWDIYNYLAMVYNFNAGDYDLYRDIYEKTYNHISSLKKLKVLNQLSEHKINIWGPRTWEKYLTGNHKYMGEAPEDLSKDVFSLSKIVLNIDERDDLCKISDKFLKAVGSNALVFTENNLIMRKYLSKDVYDIYYDINNSSYLSEKINYYLNNDDKRFELVDKLQNKVESDFTWTARVSKIKSMIN